MRTIIAKRLGFTFIGFVYGLSLAYLGIISSGGGHSNLTSMLALSPYGLGIFIWPILGFLSADFRASWSKPVFTGLMCIHFMGLIFYIYGNWEGESYWLKIAINNTNFIIMTTLGIVSYFVGQTFLWLRFLRHPK